jgi:predicted lipid-binding transport protein (Tim44 family)
VVEWQDSRHNILVRTCKVTASLDLWSGDGGLLTGELWGLLIGELWGLLIGELWGLLTGELWGMLIGEQLGLIIGEQRHGNGSYSRNF